MPECTTPSRGSFGGPHRRSASVVAVADPATQQLRALLAEAFGG